MFKAKERACLLLGGNLGAVQESFDAAEDHLQDKTRLLKRSCDYCSEPWGMDSTHDFVNRALLVETDLAPALLMQFLLEVESRLGRVRRNNGTYEDRPIDIDLLFYGQKQCREEGLTLPHPRLAERKFALMPLQEVAPEWRHPVLKQNAWEMLLNLKEDQKVEICS